MHTSSPRLPRAATVPCDVVMIKLCRSQEALCNIRTIPHKTLHKDWVVYRGSDASGECVQERLVPLHAASARGHRQGPLPESLPWACHDVTQGMLIS